MTVELETIWAARGWRSYPSGEAKTLEYRCQLPGGAYMTVSRKNPSRPWRYRIADEEFARTQFRSREAAFAAAERKMFEELRAALRMLRRIG